MSFYHLPHPWNPGFAIPKYVMAEPMERGTFTTRQLPRRTISTLPPDYLARPANTLSKNKHGSNGSLTKNKHGAVGSLTGSSLGSSDWDHFGKPLGHGVLEEYPMPTPAHELYPGTTSNATPSVITTRPQPKPVIKPQPKKPISSGPSMTTIAAIAAGAYLLLR